MVVVCMGKLWNARLDPKTRVNRQCQHYPRSGRPWKGVAFLTDENELVISPDLVALCVPNWQVSRSL